MSARRKKALRAVNYDLFVATEPRPAVDPSPVRVLPPMPSAMTGAFAGPEASAEGLPEVEALYVMYGRLNREYFNNLLPPVTIEYSNRMLSTAGSYSPSKRLIRIGRRYHEVFPADLVDTLKHEMIHIVYPDHDAAFRSEARRLQVSMKARYHPSLMKPPRYWYVCPQCGREYPRQKRLRMASCGRCSHGSRFDRRCKLTLRRT
ncbi:MAG: SprT-like domain-containing protein [bacterium]